MNEDEHLPDTYHKPSSIDKPPKRDPYGYGDTDPDLIRRSGARLAHESELRHRWHIHIELPKKKVTEKTLRRIAEIMEGRE